ncbi:MAG TPA: hypothetical protein VGD59_06130 [Acidisarcina sp.]
MVILQAASVFPWDTANESAMSHRHLMLAYGFAWALQLAYLLSVVWRRRNLRKAPAVDTRKDNH